MQDPVETSELLAFAKTVEAKSLSRAALELCVPRATISRRLARLEERLGARMLRRTTRSLVLTDAGEALYRHARIVLDAVARAEACIRRTDNAIRGDLRVSVPPISDPTFHQMICEFSKRHPDVRVHVHFGSQHVDLLRDGYDVALRATRSVDMMPGLVMRTLQRMALVAVASPSYLTEKGVPRTKRDLRRHRCLLGFAGGDLPQTQWPLLGGGKVSVEGAFFTSEVALLSEAALSGMGIAVLPAVLVRHHIASGALVHVLPDVVGGQVQIGVVYPEREFIPPQVRAFIDAVVAWAPAGLDAAAHTRSGTRCFETPAQRRAKGRHRARAARASAV
jgi:DNA-binding transcriptional LysR family regulator